MEVTASRFCTRLPFWGTQLSDYSLFIKAVRRRLSAVNQGIVLETSPANLPPSAVGLDERLRHIIENNRKRIIKPTEKHRPPSSLMCRSRDGEPFLFQTPATLKLPEGNRGRDLFLSCWPRRARHT
ncbi:hypothetical protein TcYC6_0001810 [Trypanosoma cruzi]|nr:hypothetical protein TcYC6_0001810 [Trypanosoma cruzi]